MTMTQPCFFAPRRLWRTLAAIAAFSLASACTTPVIREAHDMAKAGQNEAASAHLMHALQASPSDSSLRQAWFLQRDITVTQLAAQADTARKEGRMADVADLVKRLDAVAPEHPRVAGLRAEIERQQRHQRLLADAKVAFDAQTYERAESSLRTLLGEDPANQAARSLLSRIEEKRESQTRRQATQTLATAMQPITLEFREAPLKTVFEALARAANVNFVFDKDVRSEAKVTLFLRNTLVDEALRVILSTQQLGSKLLNENTVLVFPATQQKQRDLLDTVTRTFYLVNADPKQAQAMVRTIAKTRDIFIDERLNLLVVRDTPEVVRLVERLVANLDLPDPEVMLELEVLEVSSKNIDQLGLSWPESASFGVPGSTGVVTTDSSLRWSIANPLALATIKATRGASNLLANPKIRARNREKAKILLGEKLPVVSTTTTANVGISSSVAYIDVGLKLDIEPQVQLDNDVTIKVALEVSSVTDKTTRTDGTTLYQIGTRQASTTLRLHDGETQVLAGLLNDNESRSASGIPGLIDIPLIRHLFGTVSNTHDKTEVVLLVTPRIVRNTVQPPVASGIMPSGTESQPGASPLLLRQGAAGMGAEQGKAAVGVRAASPAGRPGAASQGEQQITGPEEVMPGASFQVAVHNPSAAPITVTLQFDPNIIEPASPVQTGAVTVTVPAQGVQSALLRARADVRLADTDIGLDTGGAPLHLRVRNPNVPSPDEPAAMPDQVAPDVPPAPAEEH
jgi:general secretion pathway protein D